MHQFASGAATGAGGDRCGRKQARACRLGGDEMRRYTPLRIVRHRLIARTQLTGSEAIELVGATTT